jgi:hypothetical protein
MQLIETNMRLAIALCLFAVTLGYIGCSEDPNPVGAGLLPGADLLKIDTVSTLAIRSYSQPAIPAASTTRLLVGKVDDLESWGVLRFFVLPDSIRYMNILSAEVILRSEYHYGDSLAPFSLTAHKVLRAWGTDSLTIDSLKAAGFYDPSPMSSLTLPFVGDTASISIPIDTTVIRSWGTISDTTFQNFGLLLQPTNSGVVKGFAMFEASDESHRPNLLMRFLRTESGKIDTVTVNIGISRFGARIGNTSWSSDSTRIYVRSGVSYRGMLEFDVSSLPPHAAIHKAVLELTLDRTQSGFNAYTVDSTLAVYVTDDGVAVSTIIGLSEPADVGDGLRVHRFPVGQFVQRWVRATTQRRIAIAGYAEQDALDLFVFHGAAALQALRPKLTIVYSLIQ